MTTSCFSQTLEILDDTINTVKLPSEEDEFPLYLSKLEPLISICNRGGSIAAATGFVPIENLRGDAEFIAKHLFTYEERRLWTAFKKVGRLPQFSETQCLLVPPASNHRAIVRVQALCKLTGQPDLTAGHVAWLWETMPHLRPLLTAQAKVDAVGRDLSGGKPNQTPLELGELQTLNHILRTLRRKHHKYLRKNAALTARMNYVVSILEWRKTAVVVSQEIVQNETDWEDCTLLSPLAITQQNN